MVVIVDCSFSRLGLENSDAYCGSSGADKRPLQIITNCMVVLLVCDVIVRKQMDEVIEKCSGYVSTLGFIGQAVVQATWSILQKCAIEARIWDFYEDLMRDLREKSEFNDKQIRNSESKGKFSLIL